MKSSAFITCIAFILASFLAGCGGDSSQTAESGAAAAESDSGSAMGEAAEAAVEAVPTGGTMVLTTEIPPQKIEGTPMPMKVPNLEPALNQAPTLVVPENTVLLSKGKTVTSSDDFPIIGELSLITDGEKEAGEGYYVELMDQLQWVQIDLEQPAIIDAVWIWHFHSQARAYNDVIVQASNDPDFQEGVTTLFNNDFDNSAGLGKGDNHPYVENRFGKLVDGRRTKARYVRLYSAGNTSNSMNHYTEVEVYGRPAS